jgi:hypothetical protein
MTCKTDIRSSQKWPDNVCSSIASLHKNGFGLASPQHNSALTAPPWPQTGLVYIDLKLVSHLQLPPKIWAPKMPNISQKWRKSIKIRHNTIKFQNFSIKTHFAYKIRHKPPKLVCMPPKLGHQWTAPCGQALTPLSQTPWSHAPFHRTTCYIHDSTYGLSVGLMAECI